jgi:hypothetical protein
MRRLPAILAAVALCAGFCVATALGQTGGTTPSGTTTTTTTTRSTAPVDPCRVHSPRLKCPDLVMRTPYDRYFQRGGNGHILYHAGNTLLNIGPGPNELFGYRTATGVMNVTQHIFSYTGSRFSFPTKAHLVFKHVPVFGNYWKFENAARFEIWTVDFHGHPIKLVRSGPKVIYCLRDLKRTHPMARSPRRFHFPGCNRSSHMRHVTLGTSVGWSDIYPATYYQQWIDVTGLRGTFAFKHVADPENGIWESNEDNNEGVTIVRLPSGRTVRRSAADADNPYG